VGSAAVAQVSFADWVDGVVADAEMPVAVLGGLALGLGVIGLSPVWCPGGRARWCARFVDDSEVLSGLHGGDGGWSGSRVSTLEGFGGSVRFWPWV